jgi:epoxyqueuosine reductase
MSSRTPQPDTAWIKAEARAEGFALAGVAPAGAWLTSERLVPWLEHGYHGEMDWLARNPEVRADPRSRFPWARSALVLGVPYRTDDETSPAQERPFSRYAWGRDYHDVIPRMLKRFAARLLARWPDLQAYWFTDTSPVLERAAALSAGIGWLGRNAMLIHQREGSYFFLAGMLLSADLPPDAPAPDRCGSCSRCIPACPTNAFVAPYVLDARRCISYLTIEHRGPIPPELRPLVGTLVFGCDICQAVCPWNERALRKEPRLTDGPFKTRPGLAIQSRELLEELLLQTEETFRTRFRKSAVKRTKRHGLARNAAVALGNLGDPEAIPALAHAAQHDSEPLVRSHACWALGQLLPKASPTERSVIVQSLGAATSDPDEHVREEARAAQSALEAIPQPQREISQEPRNPGISLA